MMSFRGVSGGKDTYGHVTYLQGLVLQLSPTSLKRKHVYILLICSDNYSCR